MGRSESWTKRYARLKEADQRQSLDGTGLDQFALAAFLAGNDEESYGIYERAHQCHLDENQTRRAIRCAFWLGLILMNSGQKARASGWMMKAQRLLSESGIPDCSEEGLLQIPKAVGALYGGQADKAQQLFGQAEHIGNKFQDTELIALSRLGQGQACIWQEDIGRGIRLFDELMVTIETKQVYPVVAGIAYCAVIETCYHVRDLRTAREWTSALTRWCARQPDIIPFRGQCLVRRAEMIQLNGEWERALDETRDACKLLTRPPGEPAAGEAFYRRGELLRLCGKSEEAEVCYQETAKWGRKPQPGLALLRLDQGQHEAAETSIRNTLLEAVNVKQRIDLLPAVVKIMARIGNSDEARAAADELSVLAKRINMPFLLALADHCDAMIYLSEEQPQSALHSLQSALTRWELLHLPYETAQTKELKGVAYQKLQDKDNANAEFAAAQWIYRQLQAQPDLERIDKLIAQKDRKNTHQLTLRELQVLRRVAAGKTNKEVAGELFISERTVDRHVSNIFNKLNVSSRTEAATVAFRSQLLDFHS